jgi:hypothetical protein
VARCGGAARWLLAAGAVVVALAGSGCGASHPALRSHSNAWLGLDYNSRPGVGRLSDFVSHGIAYDREGNIEPPAGALAVGGSKLERGLRTSFAAGMIPDVEIDPPASLAIGCPSARGCLPGGAAAISTYVRGFVATAQSVLRAFPGRRVLFEPIDEPWDLGIPGVAGVAGVAGSRPGFRSAAAYAALLAALLPAIDRASDPAIPLAAVYVPATGRLPDGSDWVADLYRAQPCLRPGPAACGPVEGWNLHVYGLPGESGRAGRNGGGIGSLPGLRARMASGADNIVVSELGFCALDVERGEGCAENTSTVDGSSQQTAAWLTQTLREAQAMHRAGWLKAVLVWARLSGGWSMQLPGGAMTSQGRALMRFADSAVRGS